MKALGCLALCLTVAATAGFAQAPAGDPFAGTWKVNLTKSKFFVGYTAPQSEVTVIRVENNVRHYDVDVIATNGSRSKLGYDAAYNDGQWHPMVNRDTGVANGDIMIIKADARTQYRIDRNKDGQVAGVLMHRLSEDGKSYTSFNMNPDGKLAYERVFDKQ